MHLPEIDGLITQTKRLEQVPAYVKDAAELLGHDVNLSTINIEAHYPRDNQIQQAKEFAQRANIMQKESSKLLRLIVRDLAADGLPFRDIGKLLGISFQRAQQLSVQSDIA